MIESEGGILLGVEAEDDHVILIWEIPFGDYTDSLLSPEAATALGNKLIEAARNCVA